MYIHARKPFFEEKFRNFTRFQTVWKRGRNVSGLRPYLPPALGASMGSRGCDVVYENGFLRASALHHSSYAGGAACFVTWCFEMDTAIDGV